MRLVEGVVGRCAPPRKDHGGSNGLEKAGDSTDGDGVERTLLGEELCDDLDALLVH